MPQGAWLWMPCPSNRILLRKILFLISLPAAALLILLIYTPTDSLKIQLPATNPQLQTLEHSESRLAANFPSTNLDLHVSNTPAAKNYTIHVWNHGERMKRRFLRSYGKTEKDPFQFCRVSNCVLSTDDSRYNESDAVLFHLHQTKDESPFHTFLVSKKYSMGDYNDVFNWSMTYRSDSDVPVPYGRTRLLNPSEKMDLGSLKNYASLKSLGIAILGSNCGGKNYRWKYVEELQKHVEVDVYGSCGTLKCPGHFMKDCLLIDKYKFYLAFENSNCREYITEKMWWNAYQKESVPVVMGAPKEDYQRLCPPHSFIHVDDYDTPEDLARYLKYLMRNDTAYNEYFEWKMEFKVLNEHGYFGSSSLHLCHICEALNDQRYLPKVYSDLDSFWNLESDCFEPLWTPKH